MHLAISGGRSSLIFKRHDFLFSSFTMDLAMLLLQVAGLLIWIAVMMPALRLVSKIFYYFLFLI